jgi:polysaccharide biosynthesis/export protein
MARSPMRPAIASIIFTIVLPLTGYAQAPAPTSASGPAVGAVGSAVAPAYLIAPGDVLRISVFQSPDLALETRVDEGGSISYPLIGTVAVGGLSVVAAEQRIAKMLRDGGFLVAPQVTIVLVQVRGSQVTVLGMVAKPGRFPLESTDNKLTDVLALAGGIAADGSDVVVLTGTRDGKPMRREIDIPNMAATGDLTQDVRLQAGDMLYVARAPKYFIYGEVQRPGTFRLERGMTVMQALATGGGLTPKGTQRGLNIHRRGADGKVQVIVPNLDDPVLSDDVIFVKESIF